VVINTLIQCLVRTPNIHLTRYQTDDTIDERPLVFLVHDVKLAVLLHYMVLCRVYA